MATPDEVRDMYEHDEVCEECPVCEGTRVVREENNIMDVMCPNCEGSGEVWRVVTDYHPRHPELEV
jgi:DnaJ-class molecular chaperone